MGAGGIPDRPAGPPWAVQVSCRPFASLVGLPSYVVDRLLHFLHILYQGVKGGGLLLPGLWCHVWQSSRALSEKELEWDKACGCLGGLLDGEEQVGQENVLVSTVLLYHPSQHPLKGLVKPLNKAVSLGWSMDVLRCFICNSQHRSIINFDINGVPWSVRMSLEILMWLKRA